MEGPGIDEGATVNVFIESIEAYDLLGNGETPIDPGGSDQPHSWEHLAL
jgi:hypothetical protein